MYIGFKRVFFAGTSDECNTVNSLTPHEATKIPKTCLATSLLSSLKYFFHQNKAITKQQTLKCLVFN